jgi:hypothetical protein
MYHLKCNSLIIAYSCTKMKSEAGPSHVIDYPCLPCDTLVTLVARLLLIPFTEKLCKYKHIVFMSTTHVLS